MVGLHRSDPENQGRALDDLKAAIADGTVAAAVCCAESTRAAYEAAGVPSALLHVIPNGVDLIRFRPDAARRLSLRTSLDISPAAPVIVFAARYDGMKNVPLFLAAARAWLDAVPDGHVLMCGAGMTTTNPGLAGDIADAFGAPEPGACTSSASATTWRRSTPPPTSSPSPPRGARRPRSASSRA